MAKLIKLSGRLGRLTREQRKDLTWFRGLVKELQESDFFGEVTLRFNDGRLVNAVKHESLKPED